VLLLLLLHVKRCNILLLGLLLLPGIVKLLLDQLLLLLEVLQKLLLLVQKLLQQVRLLQLQPQLLPL
jgi:hypothetical protein